MIPMNQVSQVSPVTVPLPPPTTSLSPAGWSYRYRNIVEMISKLEVGGAVQPGNRFVSFVRASGRGEAKLRGRFDSGARGVLKPNVLLLRRNRARVVRELSARFPLKTVGFPTFSRTTIVKPMKKQHYSRTTL